MNKSWVYILSNKNRTTIYIGVTSNILQRVGQHKSKFYKGFTAKYNCDRLVYYQEFESIVQAIAYEKKLKAGNRAKKESLINSQNPEWKDLDEEWIFPE